MSAEEIEEFVLDGEKVEEIIRVLSSSVPTLNAPVHVKATFETI